MLAQELLRKFSNLRHLTLEANGLHISSKTVKTLLASIAPKQLSSLKTTWWNVPPYSSALLVNTASSVPSHPNDEFPMSATLIFGGNGDEWMSLIREPLNLRRFSFGRPSSPYGMPGIKRSVTPSEWDCIQSMTNLAELDISGCLIDRMPCHTLPCQLRRLMMVEVDYVTDEVGRAWTSLGSTQLKVIQQHEAIQQNRCMAMSWMSIGWVCSSRLTDKI